MGAGFGNFRFQGPMPSFQFRKMRFYGHVGGFSCVSSVPDRAIIHRCGPFSKQLLIVRRNNPRSALRHLCPGLNAIGQTGILSLKVSARRADGLRAGGHPAPSARRRPSSF
jgi:hypothetical protein